MTEPNWRRQIRDGTYQIEPFCRCVPCMVARDALSTKPLTSSEPTERKGIMPSNQYRDAVAKANAHETWVCPRCDHPTVDYPAISRKDNQTAVCDRCGTEEAVRQHDGLHPWPDGQAWPFMSGVGGNRR